MSKKRSSLFEFALIFALVYLASQFVLRQFFPEQFDPNVAASDVILKAQDATVKGGHHPVLIIENKTEEELVLQDRCPMPPVDVAFNGEQRTTEETATPCEAVTSVAAGDSYTLDMAPWKYSLFGDTGDYTITLPGTELSTELSIHEPGTITQLFRTFITKPFLNALILIASVMPDYSLGLAIIVLTLIVKLVLFFPTQHALEGQKKLQAVQPKLDALKEKYKSDPQKMQQETLKIWKEEKINPMQSCLPMLIQFPVLIGLFFVIRDGSILALSTHLVYDSNMNLPWTWGTEFLGLDLLKPNIMVMPVLLMVMQFVQMKLSFAINEKKKKDKVIDVGKKKKKESAAANPQQMQQRMMLYGLPLMIGFFAIQFPAAVSLYWAVSTAFAIGQQVVVNRKHLA